MNIQKFYQGYSFDAHLWLGSHYSPDKTVFRTFAPNARSVSVLIEKKEWPMRRVYDGNFYELTLPALKCGTPYEYRIYTRDGKYTDHADPYGFWMELRPDHRTIITDLSSYSFGDQRWMDRRSEHFNLPMNVYEMHLGSWKKPGKAEWYTYDELAELLIPYLQSNGYNFVEFLPVSEHPSDNSWGYQNTGYFAATSRYGTPAQLKELIDQLHQNQIGVLLDYVPVHFAIDPYGLALYDGTALYEYPHSDVGKSEWGSYNFMHSRGEVRSFLQSAANFWLQEYHFDGLRIDAVSRILYWQGDEKRGENGNAVDFLKVMNRGLKENNPGCILIAEDSSNYPGVTRPVDQGGLGFDYKWDLGWMHDTLEYFQTDPKQRPDQYHKLTFSMMYFPHEHYMLPYSHDEVVHGKATILQKMAGSYEDKWPQARAMYLYMMVHPGKKLNFMGNEIGQLREWDEKREQDWDMLKNPYHAAFHQFMSDLNHLYLTHPALYEWDYQDKGFAWLDCRQNKPSVYAIKRQSRNEQIAAVFNFGNKDLEEYMLPLPDVSSVQILMDSQWECYGGEIKKGHSDCSFLDHQLVCSLPPFSAVLFQLEEEKKPESEKEQTEQ